MILETTVHDTTLVRAGTRMELSLHSHLKTLLSISVHFVLL